MSHTRARKKMPTAVDLFCGCGGLSSGLRQAGFQVLAGVDIEPRYIASHAHNFGGASSFGLDVATTAPTEFLKLIGIGVGELDLLAGGPPCQGFSKNVPRRQRFLDAGNNRLVSTFLEYCEFIRPKLVLMENVAEIKNGFDCAYTDEIVNRLVSAGYSVLHAVLNAADFGVPQRRRRAFFIAGREGRLPRFPTPTHAPNTEGNSLFPPRPHVSVWDAIGDLPSVQHGEGSSESEYACEPFSDYQREVRGSLRVVRNHTARYLQPTQLARLASLSPGQGLRDLPAHLRPRSGYSGAYGRLTKTMVAPTITRWVFHPGSGRWGHPIDTRVLTIREAARLQGFPDEFEFVGSYTQQAGQVGNAVPPLLARQVGLELLRAL